MLHEDILHVCGPLITVNYSHNSQDIYFYLTLFLIAYKQPMIFISYIHISICRWALFSVAYMNCTFKNTFSLIEISLLCFQSNTLFFLDVLLVSCLKCIPNHQLGRMFDAVTRKIYKFSYWSPCNSESAYIWPWSAGLSYIIYSDTVIVGLTNSLAQR